MRFILYSNLRHADVTMSCTAYIYVYTHLPGQVVIARAPAGARAQSLAATSRKLPSDLASRTRNVICEKGDSDARFLVIRGFETCITQQKEASRHNQQHLHALLASAASLQGTSKLCLDLSVGSRPFWVAICASAPLPATPEQHSSNRMMRSRGCY